MSNQTEPLHGKVIRSAIIRHDRVGNVIAADLDRERDNDPHAYIAKIEKGEVVTTEIDYDAHSICEIQLPYPGIVFVSAGGEFGIHSASESTGGDILTSAGPDDGRSGYIGFREVSSVQGRAYAAGFRAMVYRLDQSDKWIRLDTGISSEVDFETIDGFATDEIYAAGDNGAVWRFDGKKWQACCVPTNVNFNKVLCSESGTVYIAGDDGVLVRGRRDQWEVVAVDEEQESLWGVAEFQGRVFVSSYMALMELTADGELNEIDFEVDAPSTTAQLSSSGSLLWSVGEYDIFEFDGRAWRGIVNTYAA